MIAPVTSMLIMESGNKIFQPRFINWSNLNLGIVHRTQMKKKMKNIILLINTPKQMSANTISPVLACTTSMYGKLYPPKYRQLMTAEDKNILTYSANR